MGGGGVGGLLNAVLKHQRLTATLAIGTAALHFNRKSAVANNSNHQLLAGPGGGRSDGMPESTHIAPGEGVNARLGAPQPTSLEERKSPLSSTVTMQVKM